MSLESVVNHLSRRNVAAASMDDRIVEIRSDNSVGVGVIVSPTAILATKELIPDANCAARCTLIFKSSIILALCQTKYVDLGDFCLIPLPKDPELDLLRLSAAPFAIAESHHQNGYVKTPRGETASVSFREEHEPAKITWRTLSSSSRVNVLIGPLFLSHGELVALPSQTANTAWRVTTTTMELVDVPLHENCGLSDPTASPIDLLLRERYSKDTLATLQPLYSRLSSGLGLREQDEALASINLAISQITKGIDSWADRWVSTKLLPLLSIKMEILWARHERSKIPLTLTHIIEEPHGVAQKFDSLADKKNIFTAILYETLGQIPEAIESYLKCGDKFIPEAYRLLTKSGRKNFRAKLHTEFHSLLRSVLPIEKIHIEVCEGVDASEIADLLESDFKTCGAKDIETHYPKEGRKGFSASSVVISIQRGNRSSIYPLNLDLTNSHISRSRKQNQCLFGYFNQVLALSASSTRTKVLSVTQFARDELSNTIRDRKKLQDEAIIEGYALRNEQLPDSSALLAVMNATRQFAEKQSANEDKILKLTTQNRELKERLTQSQKTLQQIQSVHQLEFEFDRIHMVPEDLSVRSYQAFSSSQRSKPKPPVAATASVRFSRPKGKDKHNTQPSRFRPKSAPQGSTKNNPLAHHKQRLQEEFNRKQHSASGSSPSSSSSGAPSSSAPEWCPPDSTRIPLGSSGLRRERKLDVGGSNVKRSTAAD